jgi:predicted transcriptional regulator
MPIREITIDSSMGKFHILKRSKPKEYDFSSLSSLRRLLSNQKAKILSVIKNENPSSIYDLSKKLSRGFKSVYQDVNLLQRFGFIEIMEEKVNNRIRHRPKITSGIVTIHIKL